MESGTFRSGAGPGTVTLKDIIAARKALEAAPPPPPTDITVASDVFRALEGRGAFANMPPAFAVKVWEDARLPARAWHPGKPLDII